MSDSPLRVVVADDHALVRHGFRSILASEDDVDVIGEADDGREAVAIASSEQPDVVLMDIRMPVMDGIEATRLITTNPHLTETRVIVLTTFDLDEYVFGALKAGASAFLLKGVEPPVLIEALRTREIAGAAMDVFETEPLPPDSPLLRLDNLVVTPHLAAIASDVFAPTVRRMFDNIACVSRGSSSSSASTAKWNAERPVPSKAAWELSLAANPSRLSRNTSLDNSSLGGPGSCRVVRLWVSVTFITTEV